MLSIQGREMPQTFKGARQSRRILENMDKLFSRFHVTSDSEKVEAILPYVQLRSRFIHASLHSEDLTGPA